MRFPAARRRGLSRGLAMLAAVAAAVPAAPAMAANQQVLVTDNAFVAPGVAVAPGESVTWTYPSGGDRHNLSFEDLVPTTPPISSPISAPWTTTRTFPAAGEFRYFCEEHGGPGGQGMSGIVHVNAGATVPGSAPTASFTVSSALVTVGQAVSLNGAASSEPDAGDAIVRYEWDLDGNGSFETEGGSQPATSSTYATPGTRNIGLRVTDRQGHTTVTTRAVTVTNVPVASFTVTPGAAQTGQVVSFDASASSDPDGTIAKYEWDLDGNGSYETDTGTAATTSRAYASPASLIVGLRVTDNLGVTAITTRTLQVSVPPPPPPPPPPPVAPPPPPGGPAADATAPSLSAFSISPASLKSRPSGSSIATSGGTLVKYRLSEAATTTFTVQRVEKGRRKGSTCQKPGPSNRSGAPCTRYVAIGSFTHAGASAKLNSVRFSGRIGGRRLAPARYRMRAVARDAAGNMSAARTANFRIIR